MMPPSTWGALWEGEGSPAFGFPVPGMRSMGSLGHPLLPSHPWWWGHSTWVMAWEAQLSTYPHHSPGIVL